MNKFVKVSYSLFTISEDGQQELVERASINQPFQFITGMGVALDAFEEHIAGLNQDEDFNFVLPVEQAYGPYLEEHVIDLDKSMFCIDGHFDAQGIYPGAVIPLANDDGNRFQGIVKEVGETTVKVDLNHPLAGHTLQFKGRVLESREATNTEIQGLINMLSGEGCGCGCDDCNHEHGHDGAHCDHKHGDGHCACGHKHG